MSQPIITVHGVGKNFPGVRALDKIDMSFLSGEIHAIVGENGAGKSTLMKILAGDYVKDDGEIFIDGISEPLGSPRRAQYMGIGMIHQELTLLPDRNIAQNILLGREPRSRAGLVDRKAMAEIARENLTKLGLDLDPLLAVSSLPIALRQMVEIAKALSLNARILILDEPTSSLTDAETHILLNMIKALRDKGMSLIYISHRLEEVFETADRITVLRDGKLTATKLAAETTPAEVVRLMVGRELGKMYAKEAVPAETVLLKVEGLTGNKFRNFSMTLRAGEIVGISGLVGSGRTEFARSLSGLDPVSSGRIIINGENVTSWNVRKAVACGLVYVPEDRKEQGLFLDLSLRQNLTINILQRLSRLSFLSFHKLTTAATELIKRLNVKPPDPARRVRNLSGGNQQKIVIAKWLSLNPHILILDEPTRGIDVGAKAEIYSLIDRLASEGVGIIVISSELPEILGISDKILVMKAGDLVGELNRENATQNNIMNLAAGVPS